MITGEEPLRLGDVVRTANKDRWNIRGWVLAVDRGEFTGKLMYFVEFQDGVDGWFFRPELELWVW